MTEDVPARPPTPPPPETAADVDAAMVEPVQTSGMEVVIEAPVPHPAIKPTLADLFDDEPPSRTSSRGVRFDLPDDSSDAGPSRPHSPRSPRSPYPRSVSPTSRETTPNGTSVKKVARGRRRTTSPPVPAGPALIGDLPLAWDDALETFETLDRCVYERKDLGLSREQDEMMVCDCPFDPGESPASLSPPPHLPSPRSQLLTVTLFPMAWCRGPDPRG